MTTLRRLLYSLRAARARQLRARVERPIRRRRFPPSAAGATFAPLEAGLWLSDAFATADAVAGAGTVHLLGKDFAYPPHDWALRDEPRLRVFHLHYGDEVLGWARQGNVDAAHEALDAWITSNPPRCGDAWHPYPLSTRAGNWVAALSIAPELATAAVVDSLGRQLAYLERNVEDDVLGNHVIRNARGLILAGVALGRRSAVELGETLLRRELPEQVLPDGGHYERSPVYHLIVLRDLLELRDCAGIEWLAEPLERMRRFAAALTRPDGAPALFNDGGVDLAPKLELPTPPGGLAVFPDTGYAVVRSGRLWLAFDCGPPGPAFLPAHAHADALSIQLWWDGLPAIIDSGTWTYEPGPERDRVRSTLAHSTVALDGRSQFELWRAFRAGPLPDVRLESALGATVSARVVWPGGATHLRRIEWSGDEVVVHDRVEGGGRHRVESRIILAPGARNGSAEALEGRPTRVELGWTSERFGQRTGVDVLVIEEDGELPVELGWRIRSP